MRRVIASWFGSGLLLGQIRDSDVGSGTVGAMVAFIMSMAVAEFLGTWAQITALGAVTAASLWVTRHFVAEEGDAGWIVIDEAAGTFLATLGLTISPASLVAFVVFRTADIFKGAFPGVAAADRIEGPLGITADDIVAGAYGLVAGQAVRILL